MMEWIFICLVLSLITGIVGFTRILLVLARSARMLFYILVMLLIISLLYQLLS